MKLKSCPLKIRISAWLMALAGMAPACGNLDTIEPVSGEKPSTVSSTKNSSTGNPDCTVTTGRYPTDAQDFANLLYGHRGFLDVYEDQKHLGHDTVYTEGTAIHPVACGTIRYYGPASGYGTLAIVIEHRLANSASFTNGEGLQTQTASFLSIYGHQRKTSQRSGGISLTWKVGDTVQPEDIIGYVQADDLNGDGPEHLHLGIRLQGASEAQSADDSWFRGNDTAGGGLYKKYFTDPKIFLPILTGISYPGPGSTGQQPDATAIKRYPAGTLLHDISTAAYWLVTEPDRILNVSVYQHLPRACAVDVQPQVLGCYWQASPNEFTSYLDAQAIKFDGEPQVYQTVPAQASAPAHYRIFLSYESFLSWGLKDADITTYPLWQKSSLLATMENKGLVGFMPGALVKAWGQSEVSAADQQGLRRPILDWNLFQAMGYESGCVYDIDPTTLDIVAGPRSNQLLTLQEATQCATQWSSPGPGGGQGPEDAGGNGESGGPPSFATDGGSTNGCISGQQVGCGCLGGSQGIQVCKNDGTYDVCQCPEAGTAGMGGSGGTGGQTGSSGSGGSWTGCIPGQQSACGCLGGSQSIQVCKTDGTYGVCQCPTGGTGGADGSSQPQPEAGTGGSGGQTGSSGSGGSSGMGGSGGSATGQEAGTASGPCQTKGMPGKTTFIINASITQANVISVFGWIQYPNWSGLGVEPWGGWAWGQPGSSELAFQKGDAYQGAKYVFAPGLSPSSGQAQTSWYCEKDDCPVGTFMVCNGLQEACRFQDGVLSGGASYTPNPANWQNMQCVLP